MSIHSPEGTGFTDPLAQPAPFPTQNGAPPQNRTVVAALPKRCTCHYASGAWRKMVASNHWPCGHYGLANRAGSRPQHPPYGGRPTCRSPHLAVPSRFERVPEAVPDDLPYWRRAGAFEAHAMRHHRFSKPRRRPGRFTLRGGVGDARNPHLAVPTGFQPVPRACTVPHS